MILTDRDIFEAIERSEIVIEPFRRECLGTNSYDVHLAKTLAAYDSFTEQAFPFSKPLHYLDAARENDVRYFDIPDGGLVLMPGVLYLGVTEEYTETHTCVPFLDGKSSTGRLGIFIHATAGRGDIGFCNHWTMELSVIQPVKVYAGMPIGQLIYHTSDRPEVPYNRKADAKYNGRDPKPQPSRMYRNFETVGGVIRPVR